ncbi:MAG: imidazoleglycerol-phosphate dehydratase HisB [Planctomycetes bacterium]|nr:imidazoleglycerol-phosphate dehydratase HisB [Planctomycetota bacterium]
MTPRKGHFERSTMETHVKASVNLDGSGASEISTGMPFFDHMLAQLSKHSLIDVELRAKGDLEIDHHHTVEDVGITLGKAFHEALGSREGINRFANVIVPLDEALGEAIVDVSGRGHCHFHAEFSQEKIREFDPFVLREFWNAFAHHAGITIHLRRISGLNSHHEAESMFKAAAVALKHAVTLDPRRVGVASTKGTLH